MRKSKSTNKSADFEMDDIFIEDFEDMEVMFEESDEPNSKLGKDLEMVMQETRVFTDEEVEKLNKQSDNDGIGQTQILNADTILLDKLILEENPIKVETEISGAGKTVSEPVVDEAADEFEDEETDEETDEEDSEEFEEDDESEDDDEESEYEEDEEEDEDDEFEFDDSVPVKKETVAASATAEKFKPQTAKKETEKVSTDKNKADKKALKSDGKPSMSSNDKVNKAPKKAKPAKKKRSKAGGNGFVEFLKSMGPTEYIMIGVAVVILVLLGVVLVKVSSKNTQKNQVKDFASVGALLENLNGIGDEGLQAVAERAHIDSMYAPVDYGYDLEENAPVQTVAANVGFASIEKDLKIKFSDKATGLLITGIAFEVTAMGPDGKVYTWTDDDMDGLITLTNLLPGEYQVIITSIGDYEFPTTPTPVKVQDSIVYQAVNVIDEVKQMKDVNLAEEEFLGDVPEETRLRDTITWIESSVKYTTGYEAITDKSTIQTPSVAKNFNARFATVAYDAEVNVGETKSLTHTNAGSFTSDTNFNYHYRWESGNSSVCSVSSAITNEPSTQISGVADGETTITVFIEKEISQDNWAKIDGSEMEFKVKVGDAGTGKVQAIIINGAAELPLNSTLTLTATVSPENAVDKSIEWSSSNTNLAEVDQTGKVTPKGIGKVSITAKAKDGSNISASVEIDVVAAPELKLSVQNASGAEIKELEVPVGTDYQLKIVVTGATDTSVKCVSGTPSSATVTDAGLIHPLAKGTTTTITVTTNAKDFKTGNPVSVNINVKVVAADPKNDTVTPLKTKNGEQVYVKLADGSYRAAAYADYYIDNTTYYIQKQVPMYTGWQTINGKVFFYKSDGNPATGEQVIQGTKYNFASNGELSMNGGQLGIDVSSYQGNVDWKAVKNAGISFVILRCGFRGYTQGGLIADDKFAANIQGANSAGLKVGIYIFSQAINEKEAIEEASYCIQLAKKYKVSYPIFIDTEKVAANGARANGLDKNTRTAVCVAFCKTIQNAGYTPGVYANKNWLNNNVNVSEFGPYKIWMAQYVSVPDYKGRYEIWQHTDKGSVSGIKGNVDLDISYLGY